MRAGLLPLLIALTLVAAVTAGCSKPTMQGTPEREPGMVLTTEDLPSVVLSESELAELTGVPVDEVENSSGNNPKAEEPAAIASPDACNVFRLDSANGQSAPDVFVVRAFLSDGAKEPDLGTETTNGAAVFASPSQAVARFDEIQAQIQPCAEHEVVDASGFPLVIHVRPLALEGFTLPALVIERKAVISPSLQGEGFGVTIGETYFLFRNTVVRVSIREVGIREIDLDQLNRISLALQQHLVSLA